MRASRHAMKAFRLTFGTTDVRVEAQVGGGLHSAVKRRIHRGFLIRHDGALLVNGEVLGHVEPLDDVARAAFTKWCDGMEYL